MWSFFVVASLLLCLACVSAESGTPGNEVNGFGSGFTAIAKDLNELAREGIDLKQNISVEADTERTLNLERQNVHDRLESMKREDERLHAKLQHSEKSTANMQHKYKHALAFIKNKYEANIKAILPRLQTCGKRRDELASELNVASAELYMAQERFQQAQAETNSTKKNWTNLVDGLARAVDEDEERIIALRGNMSKNEKETRRTLVGITDMLVEGQQLQQVLTSASGRLQTTRAEAAHLSESIHHEQLEGAELKKESDDLGERTHQLLKKIKDQVHAENSSKVIAEATSNASNVQKMHMQEIIAARKARIAVANDETEKAAKQLQAATQLLAKDRAVIAQFQNQTAIHAKTAKADCAHEFQKAREEAGHRTAALQVALDEARHAEDVISAENHELTKEAEALKQQIAHSMIH